MSIRNRLIAVLLIVISTQGSIVLAQETDSISLYLKRAGLEMNSRQWDQARFNYMRVVHLDSTNVEALRNMGFIASVNGDQKTARYFLDIALRFGPKDPEVHNNLGVVSETEKKYEEAVSHFTRASELAPDKALYLVHAGNTLALAGKPLKGIPYLQNALSIDTSDWEIPYFIGTSYSDAGQFDSAEVYFVKSVGRGGKSARLHYFLGVVQRKLGKYEECEKNFREALRLSPDYLACRQDLGILYSMSGQFNKAVDQFERLVASDSTFYPGLVSLGVAYALDRQFAKADTVLYRLNQIDSTFGRQMQQMIKAQASRFKKRDSDK